MKILYPIGSFYPAQSGGPNNTIYWLTKFLYKKNIITTVITTNKDINGKVPLNKMIKSEAGRVMYCKEYFHFLPIRMLIKSFTEVKNHDIIHLTSLFYFPSLLIAFYSRIKGKKIIWSTRGELEAGAIKYKKNIKKIYLFIIKIILNDNIIFHSTSTEETKNIKKMFQKSDLVEIPNYLEITKMKNQKLKKQFIFLGRIHPIKNLEILINAISTSITFKKSGFKIIIAGDGKTKYIEKLKTMIKVKELQNYILFRGFVDLDDKDKILSSSYFLVLPSLSENFGNVVLESLTQGTPVIASSKTPWKLLNEYNAGLYIDNTIENWKNALENTIALDDYEYKDFRTNAYRLVDEKFNIEKNIGKWIDIYNKILHE
tara:strand:- start:12859 stop:13974 length:1116 start_codon:yes stop_codon:yes gene_type:complete